ncbi:hypothetical protein ACP70R_000935 [Stipagrostis hirtigluma subsp. patula]
MDARPRRDGRRAASPTNHRGRERHGEQQGPRTTSPRTGLGRERHQERYGSRADSPTTRRGRERRRERHGPRARSPSTRRGRERRREQHGPRDSSASNRRGRERLRERDGPRASSPSTNRGCGRRRERHGPRTASPTVLCTRRGGERRSCASRTTDRGLVRPRSASPTVHSGDVRRPRTASPTTSHGVHESHQQVDGSRSSSPTPHGVLEDQQEQYGSRHAPLNSYGVHERQGRDGERDGERDAPPPTTPHAVAERQELHEPRASAPSTNRGWARRRERHGPRTASPTISCPRRGGDCPRSASRNTHISSHVRTRTASPTTDSLHGSEQEMVAHPSPPTSYGAHERHLELEEPRTVPPTSSGVQELDGPCPAPLSSHGAHDRQGGDGERDAQRTATAQLVVELEQGDCIFRLREDLLGEILSKLAPAELCRSVCCNRAMLRIATRIPQPPTPIHFIGVLALRGKSRDLITFNEPRLARGLQRSVNYVQGSLKKIPEGFSIVDCKFGFMALKSAEKICVWNPFWRDSWMLLPSHEVQEQQ